MTLVLLCLPSVIAYYRTPHSNLRLPLLLRPCISIYRIFCLPFTVPPLPSSHPHPQSSAIVLDHPGVLSAAVSPPFRLLVLHPESSSLFSFSLSSYPLHRRPYYASRLVPFLQPRFPSFHPICAIPRTSSFSYSSVSLSCILTYPIPLAFLRRTRTPLVTAISFSVVSPMSPRPHSSFSLLLLRSRSLPHPSPLLPDMFSRWHIRHQRRCFSRILLARQHFHAGAGVKIKLGRAEFRWRCGLWVCERLAKNAAVEVVGGESRVRSEAWPWEWDGDRRDLVLRGC
ncbi:hypothetical protein R3P38DRAFT_1328912 [Favolaschia claudopus]|uniref:Uncharacterized protein n=1 Tax=Favolaschia claudopus TaxID=2862362 RepID=A0AAW0AWF8_9AGAR